MKLLHTLILAFLITSCTAQSNINEYVLEWPNTAKGSTHELVIDSKYVYVTGQNMHHVARSSFDGKIVYWPMPEESGPHGILFDKADRLWVSLEFHGLVVRLDDKGKIVEEVDVKMYVKGANKPINPYPHGIGLDADGETIWFTGKKTSTVGKINPDKTVSHFELPTLAAMPIYLHAGPDGNMWGTELIGNKILRVTPEGEVSEFPIPTRNSRPIAIKPDPKGPFMWFSEEAGHSIGKIDMKGNITEFPVPNIRPNQILAGLTFDPKGNLWTQSYVDANNPDTSGSDYLIQFDKAIQTASAGDISKIGIKYLQVPSTGTIMHRIKADATGNIWFTELAKDRLGKVSF